MTTSGHKQGSIGGLSACLALLALGAFGGSAAGQAVVRCTLDEGPRQWEGTCEGFGDMVVRLRLDAGPGSEAPWKGALFGEEGRDMPVELAPHRFGSEERLVFRSALGWFRVEEWRLNEQHAALLTFDMSRVAPPTMADVRILEDAVSRWEDDSEWDRVDDRNCENDVGDAVSLYCALALATREEMGREYHRQPALRLVREEIRTRFAERVTGHALMDFNNHPETTLTDVRDVLASGLRRARRDVSGAGSPR